MVKLELVASAISSMINVPVKTYDECLANGWKIPPTQFLDVSNIHKSSLNRCDSNESRYNAYKNNSYENRYNSNKNNSYENRYNSNKNNSYENRYNSYENTRSFRVPNYDDNDNNDLFIPIINTYENTNLPRRITVRKITQPYQIFVKPLAGGSHAMLVYPHTTILELKYKIQRELGYDVRPLRLVFSDKQLDDNKTLSSYNIRKSDTIQILFRVYGGFNFYVIKKDFINPQFDFDFSKLADDGKVFTRGKELYRRPYGWNRIALNVDKYGSDKKWLSNAGKSGEWPVSYHGTKKDVVDSIADKGYLLRKGKRFAYGKGIYSTPDIDIAEEYATEFKHAGVVYKVVFQNRVNPKGLMKIEDCDYWIVSDEKNIRPYGLCLKKV
jgi:hypothetical protein